MADEVSTDMQPVADTAPKRGRPPAPKTMKVMLRADVWVPDPTPENPEQTKRLQTNIVQYDENMLVKTDQKSGLPITVEAAHEIDADFAKRLIKAGQAYLPDDE